MQLSLAGRPDRRHAQPAFPPLLLLALGPTEGCGRGGLEANGRDKPHQGEKGGKLTMVQRSQWKRLDCSASHLDKGCGSVWEGCDDRNDEHYFDHVRCTQDGMNDLIRAVVAGSERGADGEDVLGRDEEDDDDGDEVELDEAGDDDDDSDDSDDSDDEGDERLAAAKGEN